MRKRRCFYFRGQSKGKEVAESMRLFKNSERQVCKQINNKINASILVYFEKVSKV